MLIVFESQQVEAEGKYQESIHKIVVYIRPVTAHWLIGTSSWAREKKMEGCCAYFLDKTALLVNMFVNPWCRARFSCEIARQLFWAL